MKYVFLDIEWNSWMENQVDYSEVLQIGSIICDEKLQEKKSKVKTDKLVILFI